MHDLGELLQIMQSQIASQQYLIEAIIDSMGEYDRRNVNIKFYSEIVRETISLSMVNRAVAFDQAKRVMETISSPNVMLSLEDLEITKLQADMMLELILEGVEKV